MLALLPDRLLCLCMRGSSGSSGDASSPQHPALADDCPASRPEPTRAEPNRAEPDRSDPNRPEPNRSETKRTEPDRCGTTRYETTRTEPNQAEPLHVVEEQVNMGTRTPVSQVEVVLKVAPFRSGCNCIGHYGKQTSSL